MDGSFMIREHVLTDGERDNILNEIGAKISQLRLRDYRTQGELLIRVKETYLRHGEWLDWLHENVSFSHRHAERLMRTAKWLRGKDAAVKSLDFTKAYALSRLTPSEYKDFIDKVPIKKIESMKKAELELLVREYVESHR